MSRRRKRSHAYRTRRMVRWVKNRVQKVLYKQLTDCARYPIPKPGLTIVTRFLEETLGELAVPEYSVVVHEATEEDRRLRRSPRIELSFRDSPEMRRMLGILPEPMTEENIADLEIYSEHIPQVLLREQT